MRKKGLMRKEVPKRTKVLLVALAAAVHLAETASAQQVAPALPPETPSPSWYIFDVKADSRPDNPGDTIRLVISTEQYHASKLTAIVFYDRELLPELLAYFDVNSPILLIGKQIRLVDRDDPVLKPIVIAGMSLSNIPNVPGQDPQ